MLRGYSPNEPSSFNLSSRDMSVWSNTAELPAGSDPSPPPISLYQLTCREIQEHSPRAYSPPLSDIDDILPRSPGPYPSENPDHGLPDCLRVIRTTFDPGLERNLTSAPRNPTENVLWTESQRMFAAAGEEVTGIEDLRTKVFCCPNAQCSFLT